MLPAANDQSLVCQQAADALGLAARDWVSSMQDCSKKERSKLGAALDGRPVAHDPRGLWVLQRSASRTAVHHGRGL